MTGRTLVICEKPTAARRIAQALDDDGAPEEFKERGVSYYIARKGRRDLIVVSALGHLYTVAQDGGTWTYPTFNYTWVPSHEADKRLARTRSFIDVISKLSMSVEGYVSACDYDMEGSLIAYMVLLHICGKESLKFAKRMKYSTLTERDLRNAWEGMSDTLDLELIEAGRTRHEVDWLFGINLSRALTLSVKNTTGFFRVLSIGRVQGPTLNFIKEREVEIRTFVPTPFWVIKAGTRIDGENYPLEYEKTRLDTRREAEDIVSACRKREGVVEKVRTKRQEQLPFPPFNLGDLQREAYYKFRYSPRTTLMAAERLYLEALISYPRTSSQRLPPSINLREILEGLQKRKEYKELVDKLLAKSRLRPRQGSKDDLAHPAIHPTGRLPGRLRRNEARIFDLICRRFMASLGDPSIQENIEADVDVYDHLFKLRGSRVIERGWMVYYEPYVREKKTKLPSLREGLVIPITNVKAVERYTKPPPRFNPGSLLKLMEDEAIGTKATRTDVIDTLFKRGYIEGNNIEITDLGFTIVETLGQYVPGILSVGMTRDLEQDLEWIQTGETYNEAVIKRAVEELKPILTKFKANMELIGSEINEALRREAQKASFLGNCPSCETGEIRIIRSKETGKRFAGCSNYFNDLCNVSYPLPQSGKIQATGKFCPECGAPVIKVIRRRRRPWELCLNFECPTKRRVEKNGE